MHNPQQKDKCIRLCLSAKYTIIGVVHSMFLNIFLAIVTEIRYNTRWYTTYRNIYKKGEKYR